MQWKAVLDRFEGDYGILLCTEQEIEVNLPRQLLPVEIVEGDHLLVQLEIDQESTKAAKERVTRLLDKLINRPDKD